MTEPRSILARYRGPIIAIAGIAVVAVVAAFLLLSSSQPVYACDSLASPAPSAGAGASSSDGTLAMPGQPEDDMGRLHVSVGTSVRYPVCPPASGSHYNQDGAGPIQARFYGPDESVAPQGWIHNLEHGGMAVLYRCGPKDDCSDAALQPLRQLVGSLPPSPVCKFPPGELSPVVAPFDQMSTPYAAVVWDRVLLLDKADVAAITDFYEKAAEQTNPEAQCSNTMTPGGSGSPSAAPSPSASR